MYKALRGYLRGFSRNGFTGRAARLISAAALALLLPVMACAYTVVLRSGRRIEIPASFTVTKWTLTYEAAPGINITLQMATIDVPATERANNEPPGALLKRAQQQAANPSAAQARAPRRELTKQDIERARRERAKSERDYERRRVELGLPSLEETRRRTEEETKRLGEMTRQAQAEEAQAEAYWRARSTQLRTEIAALDAQINYVRARLAEIPDYGAVGAYGFITNVVPFFPRHRPVTRFPVVTGHPGFMRGNRPGAQLTGFLAFGGGATQGQVRLNRGFPHRGFGRRGIFAPGIIAPVLPVFGAPYSDYDYAGERANLVNSLHELEAARAGLQARWRLLEEEARRAGALPGWLRP
jgi:hypothetical protein